MFTVTRAAARQIRKVANDGDMEELALRIAAARESDGGITYRMGFDEVSTEDTLISAGGVDILIGGNDKELLQGATLDFVELEPGRPSFVFLNPNDPHFRPPKE